MRYYIGVDGGGTKTKFTLAREDGTVIGMHTAGTCHYLQCGYDSAAKVIREGIDAVLEKGSVTGSRTLQLRDVARVFIGCAGYGDVQEDTQRLDDVLVKAIPIPFTAGNDCENAHAGALAGKAGINLIAGTGSMGYGVNECGETARCGGWHHALGSDEGGGYWMGWRLLREFMRQSDGRDARTALYDRIRKSLSLRTDDQLIGLVVEQWGMDRTRIASLAPLVQELLAEGDPHAEKIVLDAAQELFDIARALRDRLGFAGQVPVSGTGSIFKIGVPLLDPLAEKLAEGGMVYTPPVYEPDLGAVLLAMRQDGLTSFHLG
ncbi:MAG: ATPase [Firmicutes bacterium]|nr:ATPase [Bacillota bacterium]MBQ3964108.1 ATPase [Bacillota bacterium]